MYDVLKDNDLIITDNKDKILNYLFENKKLLNIKIMTKKEFENEYFGHTDERALYYLCHKYHYKYNVAKEYLNNFLFNENLKKELDENNLIIYNEKFKENIKRIVIDNVNLDTYIIDEIKKYENIYLKEEVKNYIKTVYEADNILEEVNFVILNIIELLKTVNIDKIHLLNVGKEYYLPLKRLFYFYNIPLDLNESNYIYSDESVKRFLNKLDEKDLSKALLEIDNEDIYTLVLNICNQYSFTDVDDTTIDMIKQEIKEIKIENIKLKNSINIVDKINNEDDYYFILGFNQDSFPRTFKDDDFLSDKQKKEYGILTSYEKNIYEKKNLKRVLLNNKNITISYKKYYLGEECYPSRIIDECNFKVDKINNNDYTHSNLYNKMTLAQKLDEYVKFNVLEEDIDVLYSNYKNIPYMTYDNQFDGINKDKFHEFVDNKILLAYTSLNNYNNCSFKYYLEHILKIDPYEETYALFIGNLFHDILSKSFNENFDFEKEFNEYIKGKELSSKEKHLLDNLKSQLLFTIDVIKAQNENTNLKDELYEQKIYTDDFSEINFTFMGVIDKIKYKKEGNKVIAAVIDYKTGTLYNSLNNLPYGINIQLPIYIYLLKNSKIKNVEIAGFYLQKIVHNKLKYDSKKDLKEELKNQYKLDGYTNSNLDVLKELDKNYENSDMLATIKYSNSKFSAYSRVLNENQIEKIYNMVKENIKSVETKIANADFKINPKKQDEKLDSCQYCKYKDICFRKQENYVYLENQKYKDFLGGAKDELN